jgi:hypothetical protein
VLIPFGNAGVKAGGVNGGFHRAERRVNRIEVDLAAQAIKLAAHNSNHKMAGLKSGYAMIRINFPGAHKWPPFKKLNRKINNYFLPLTHTDSMAATCRHAPGRPFGH